MINIVVLVVVDLVVTRKNGSLRGGSCNISSSNSGKLFLIRVISSKSSSLES